MLKRVITACVLLLAMQSAISGDLREIHLKDGTVMVGEVETFDGQRYSVRSASLGTVMVHRSQIAAIVEPSRSVPAAPPQAEVAGSGAYSPQDIASMQQRLMADQEVMALIQSLQNSPHIQAILNDPQLMQAIFSGDLQALQNDARIQSLMRDPTVQQIQRKALAE